MCVKNIFCRIVVLAGDVSPLDVISHMPVVCEDADIPYCYAPSKDVSNYKVPIFEFFRPVDFCIRD